MNQLRIKSYGFFQEVVPKRLVLELELKIMKLYHNLLQFHKSLQVISPNNFIKDPACS